MNRGCLLLPATAAGVGRCGGARTVRAASITCDRGPIASKTYGGTAWDIYGCSDNRSVAVVTARGNPGLPDLISCSPNAAATTS